MPNYDEILQQSETNVLALSSKLKQLDELHDHINELLRQPEAFDVKLKELKRLSESHTASLATTTQKYLDGSNLLLTEKLQEFSTRTSDLQLRNEALKHEVDRLLNTDFTKLFQTLQTSFIEQTRSDLAVELAKFDGKSNDLQEKIDSLKNEITRLGKIDLEKHFATLQKTLSEIFGAVNSINVVLTSLTQTLAGIGQSLGGIQNTIDTHHRELKGSIESFSVATELHLNNQDEHAKKYAESFEGTMKALAEQNDLLIRQTKINRTIQIVGFSVVTLVLIYLAFKR